MTERINSFYNRVMVERKVLQLVNDSHKYSYLLRGLTVESINKWAIENTPLSGQELVSALLEISKLCNIKADNSKEVFDCRVEDVDIKIEKLICRMKEILN